MCLIPLRDSAEFSGCAIRQAHGPEQRRGTQDSELADYRVNYSGRVLSNIKPPPAPPQEGDKKGRPLKRGKGTHKFPPPLRGRQEGVLIPFMRPHLDPPLKGEASPKKGGENYLNLKGVNDVSSLKFKLYFTCSLVLIAVSLNL